MPASTLASLLLHGALIALLWRAPPPRRYETVKIDIVESSPPPKPPPIVAPPKPRIVEPREAKALPPDAPEAKPREPDAPPPPNQPSPPAKAPIRIGISLSSTTESGGFAAPVGNTLYGQLPQVAPNPDEVKPYAAEKYVAPTQVTVLPRPVSVEIPKGEYPPDALAQGLEADVILKLLVDETGKVAEATALGDPGHGFAAAAVRIAKRYFRFEPARRGSEPVATWLRFTVRFEAP